jgi:hypothetical protein
MNIFVLDYNPVKAARYQCDSHVVKMSLESAQILCSAFEPGTAPYKRTHFNHPCSIWARTSKENYEWLLEHAIALCDEYTYRYDKVHKSKRVILWCKDNINLLSFSEVGKTKFVLCFDDEYKIGNAVESYRKYYMDEKSRMAKWANKRPTPKWYQITKQL